MNIVVGSHVWVEDPNVAWIDGEVTAITNTNATVVITNGDATKTVRHAIGRCPKFYMNPWIHGVSL